MFMKGESGLLVLIEYDEVKKHAMMRCQFSTMERVRSAAEEKRRQLNM